MLSQTQRNSSPFTVQFCLRQATVIFLWLLSSSLHAQITQTETGEGTEGSPKVKTITIIEDGVIKERITLTTWQASSNPTVTWMDHLSYKVTTSSESYLELRKEALDESNGTLRTWDYTKSNPKFTKTWVVTLFEDSLGDIIDSWVSKVTSTWNNHPRVTVSGEVHEVTLTTPQTVTPATHFGSNLERIEEYSRVRDWISFPGCDVQGDFKLSSMVKLNNASQTQEMKLNYKEVIPAPLEEFDIEFEATGTAPVVGQEPPLITVVHNGLLGVEPKWSQTLNLVPTAGIPTARWGFVNPRPSFYSLEGIENSAELMSQRLWAALSEAPPAAANWNDPNRPN